MQHIAPMRAQREVVNRIYDLQEQGVHVKALDRLINTAALRHMAPVIVGLLTGLVLSTIRRVIAEAEAEGVEI